MTAYEEWNKAVVSYITAGVSIGSEIYLSIDTGDLESIASGFLQTKISGDKAEHEFLQAVRQECVDPSRRRVRIAQLRTRDGFGYPRGVAFLTAMVLAAHRMRETEDEHLTVDETNYFVRLRDLLGLEGSGRPEGMPTGVQGEENLWLRWNDWLVENGWQPTAQRGEAARAYVNYPLSQTILRDSEKDYLEKVFRDAIDRRLVTRFMDVDQISAYLSRFDFPTRPRLGREFHSNDAARRSVFCEAGYAVYESVDWDARTGASRKSRVSQRSIQAGLLRRTTVAEGVTYWLLPRQRTHYWGQSIEVLGQDQKWHSLQQQREGYFTSPWATQDIFLDDAERYKCQGDPVIKDMIFPARSFWVLVQDPEDPIGGEWGTWADHSEVGEELLVVVSNAERGRPFHELMNLLRERDLIAWRDRSVLRGWTEYHGCVVKCYDLEIIQPPAGAELLWDRLRPYRKASVRLVGGLPVRNPSGWLHGYPPAIEIVGFFSSFRCRLKERERVLQEQQVDSGAEFVLSADLSPGHYEVEVLYDDRVETRKRIYIVGDQDLLPSGRVGIVATQVVGCSSRFALRGASLEEFAE